ncbi:MAG: hypothetical protein ACO1OB_06150 [Archangium sp.]
MRIVLLLAVFSVTAFGQDVNTRGKAAQAAAKKRGPIPVPDDDATEQCFVPKFLEGETCAEGFKLCKSGLGHASCTGYGSSTTTLQPVFEGEPSPPITDVETGEVAGIPYFHEAGSSVDVEVDTECSLMGSGFGVIRGAGESDQTYAARREQAQKEFEAGEKVRFAKCKADVQKRIEKERSWQRCELLSVDACRGEAFLQCTGNVDERGLVRAWWTRSKNKPASETLKVQVLRK